MPGGSWVGAGGECEERWPELSQVGCLGGGSERVNEASSAAAAAEGGKQRACIHQGRFLNS